jgi:hypothetical protein
MMSEPSAIGIAEACCPISCSCWGERMRAKADSGLVAGLMRAEDLKEPWGEPVKASALVGRPGLGATVSRTSMDISPIARSAEGRASAGGCEASVDAVLSSASSSAKVVGPRGEATGERSDDDDDAGLVGPAREGCCGASESIAMSSMGEADARAPGASSSDAVKGRFTEGARGRGEPGASISMAIVAWSWVMISGGVTPRVSGRAISILRPIVPSVEVEGGAAWGMRLPMEGLPVEAAKVSSPVSARGTRLLLALTSRGSVEADSLIQGASVPLKLTVWGAGLIGLKINASASTAAEGMIASWLWLITSWSAINPVARLSLLVSSGTVRGRTLALSTVWPSIGSLGVSSVDEARTTWLSLLAIAASRVMSSPLEVRVSGGGVMALAIEVSASTAAEDDAASMWAGAVNTS